jgi:hypothetical protein
MIRGVATGSMRAELGRRWQRASADYLRDYRASTDGTCVACRRRPATCVDHVLSRRLRPDVTWDRTNWRPVCRACNTAKRNREQSALAAEALAYRHGQARPATCIGNHHCTCDSCHSLHWTTSCYWAQCDCLACRQRWGPHRDREWWNEQWWYEQCGGYDNWFQKAWWGDGVGGRGQDGIP